MNKSRNKEKVVPDAHEQQQEILIAWDEFEMYLTTLEPDAAKEFKEVIQNHAFVDINEKKGYFTGKNQIMLEIRYLIDGYTNQVTDLQNTISYDQSLEQSRIKKQTIYCNSIKITPQNMTRILKDLHTVSATPATKYQLKYSPKNSSFKDFDSDLPVIITNRCRITKHAYLIFEHIHQVLQLQMLIEDELLFRNLEVIDRDREMSMFQVQLYDERRLFCFRRNDANDWKKFFLHMKKNFTMETTIIIKNSLFDQLINQRQMIKGSLVVVMDQREMRVKGEDIYEFKVFENKCQSIKHLVQIVVELLKRGQQHSKYKNVLLNQISCFNLFLLEQKGTDKMFYINQQKNNTKRYIYFTFYRVLMVINQDPQTKVFHLKQTEISNEISNKHYKMAIENIKKHAIVNQLPFFMIPQEADLVSQIYIKDLDFVNLGDISKLMALKYMLEIKKIKLTSTIIKDENQLRNSFEEPFTITFDKKSPIYKKMGQLKDPEIIKKEKIKQKEKGLIMAGANFARLFIDKCLNEATQ